MLDSDEVEAQPEPTKAGRPRGAVAARVYALLEAGEWVYPGQIEEELGCTNPTIYGALKRWRERHGHLVESKDEHGRKRYRASAGEANDLPVPARNGFLSIPCALPGVGSLLQVVGVVLTTTSGATLVVRDDKGSTLTAQVSAANEGGN